MLLLEPHPPYSCSLFSWSFGFSGFDLPVMFSVSYPQHLLSFPRPLPESGPLASILLPKPLVSQLEHPLHLLHLTGTSDCKAILLVQSHPLGPSPGISGNSEPRLSQSPEQPGSLPHL